MAATLSGETSGAGAEESMIHEDRRRRRRESFLRPNVGDFNKIEVPDVHGKNEDYHVEFRISPRARAIGQQTARLFQLSLNQYAKASFLRDLGLIYEPLDARKRR